MSESTKTIEIKDLDGIVLHRVEGDSLRAANLGKVYLRRANLAGADLTGANLRDCDLREADLSCAILSGVGLDDANLESANLVRADLSHIRYARNANLKLSDLFNANMTSSYFISADFTYATLSRANLAHAQFISCKLDFSWLCEANLSGAVFQQCNMSSTYFYGTDLTCVRRMDSCVYGGSGLESDRTTQWSARSRLLFVGFDHKSLRNWALLIGAFVFVIALGFFGAGWLWATLLALLGVVLGGILPIIYRDFLKNANYDNQYILSKCGWSCYNNDEYDKAIDDFTEAIRIDPKGGLVPLIYIGRGLACSGKEEYDQAIDDFSECLRLNPNDGGAYCERGNVWQKKGEYDRAIDDYTEAIRVDPNDALAYNNRGQAWHKKGEYDRANKDFGNSIRFDGDYYAIADCNCETKDMDNRRCNQVIDDCTEAIRLAPNNAVTYSYRGYAWYSKGKYDRAIDDYTEAIRLDSSEATAFFNRGNAWQNKDVYDQAINDYTEAIRLDPAFTRAYGNLAWLLATCNDEAFRDGTRAVDCAKRICEPDGGNNHERDILAVAYAEVGEFKKAVETIQQVINGTSDFYPVYRDRLATFKKNRACKEFCVEGQRKNSELGGGVPATIDATDKIA